MLYYVFSWASHSCTDEEEDDDDDGYVSRDAAITLPLQSTRLTQSQLNSVITYR